MPRLLQLPTEVITKIAAGEVIERPASVVKELLENSVDAGATRIDIEIEQGGVDLIRVVDDGCGISADDLPLAFASHATSKLTSADDLFRIGTLGFRGEALASIGGVCQATLQSRPSGQTNGAEISCQGGVVSPVRPWNGSPGTRLEVRNLFFNTPVRRTFLRASGTEFGHISEAFTRLALAHPRLHLSLRHNDKSVYEIPAGMEMTERLGMFFGADIRERIYRLEARQGSALLRGYIVDPAYERGNAKLQYLFVNGRWIRDRSLSHALQEAYRGLLMAGRYAVAFLFLELPPDQVDVNVHPTKAEVRFRDAQAMHHLVFAAVRERLQKEDLTGRLRIPTQPLAVSAPQSAGFQSAPGFFSGEAGSSRTVLPFPSSPSGLGKENHYPPASAPIEPSSVPPHDKNQTAVHPLPEIVPEAKPLASNDFKVLQLYDAYLVVETPEGMLVIDQHALHERILFEQLKTRLRTDRLESQRLLIPEPVDLPAEQSARALEQRDALAELGLQIDDFGGGTLLLTSYPAVLGSQPPQTILRAVVDYLVAKDQPPSREVMLNELLSLMACHAAVKAGDRLT
ncbi:MAG TPA: DNA mismatch repair endonuclease MutL, partial [Gemmataceae bacterium]|nr:DNA mismatch repair endonuclease MutL [Gemmataceae bacterium]